MVWDIAEYIEVTHRLVKELNDENKILHQRLQAVELILTRLISKEPVK